MSKIDEVKPEKKILGYKHSGVPLYDATPGMVYTQCFITCCRCNQTIRSFGGPAYGAQCVNCYTPPENREHWVKPGDEDKGNFATELWDARVGCEHDIQPAPGGGVKCTKCSGWFCY